MCFSAPTPPHKPSHGMRRRRPTGNGMVLLMARYCWKLVGAKLIIVLWKIWLFTKFYIKFIKKKWFKTAVSEINMLNYRRILNSICLHWKLKATLHATILVFMPWVMVYLKAHSNASFKNIFFKRSVLKFHINKNFTSPSSEAKQRYATHWWRSCDTWGGVVSSKQMLLRKVRNTMGLMKNNIALKTIQQFCIMPGPGRFIISLSFFLSGVALRGFLQKKTDTKWTFAGSIFIIHR